MSLTVSDLQATLERAMPVRDAGFELSLYRSETEPPVFEEADGGLRVRVMLCTLEEDGSVRDIKQQEVYFLGPAQRLPEQALRTEAYVRGWLRALPALVAAMPYPVEQLMPHDLLLPEALNDAALVTEEDFAAAFADTQRVARWARESALAQLREELAPWGIEDRAEEFAALRQPAIHLAYPSRIYRPDEVEADDQESDTEPTPVGATHLGGEPDLPPSVPWPHSGDRPMTFAAQLDLAALGGFPAARALPRQGLLSFFYDAAPAGDFRSHIEYPCRVLHIPSREGLQRRTTPPGGDRRPEFTVEPQALTDTMPPLESPFYEALLSVERVMKFRHALRNQEPFEDPLAGLSQYLVGWSGNDADDEYAHQVLGYCRPYQGDPYLEAEVYSAEKNWDDWVEGSREAVETSRRARRFRLLLQLNAMCEGELLFNQDCGYLYFLIPEDALAAQDWSRVFCVLQCS